MGRIDDAIRTLEQTPDQTERALQLAGLISTLFKIKGVGLVVTHQLAFDCYVDSATDKPEVDLAVFTGELTPRIVLEVMRGSLRASGSFHRWVVAGIPVRFQPDALITCRDLCCDFSTNMGVVKFAPVEEITADYILAAHYPEPDPNAHARAHLLLVSALADHYHLDWQMLHALCHRPTYRMGDELAQMRLAAKREVNDTGRSLDHVGETSKLPFIAVPGRETASLPSAQAAPTAALEEAPLDEEPGVS